MQSLVSAETRQVRSSDDLAFLAERLGAPVTAVSSERDGQLQWLLDTHGAQVSADRARMLRETILKARSLKAPAGHAIRGDLTLVVAPIPAKPTGMLFATILPVEPKHAISMVALACEVSELRHKTRMQKLQLDGSAEKNSRRFRERRWLRELAKSLALSSQHQSPISLAEGLLNPVRGLLQADGLYLIASGQSSQADSLSSARFGQCELSVQAIERLVKQLGIKANCSPIVMNHVQLIDGAVHSLLAVPLNLDEVHIGVLIAINRVASVNNANSHLEQSVAGEFGGLELALLEDAGVLMCAQVHNLGLLLESQHLLLGSLRAMSRAIDARDPYTQGHSERVARLAYELAKIMGLSEIGCQEIYIAGVLHDIGKIGIPDSVLLKNGALTADEFATIKKHPEIGHQIIQQMGKLHFVLPGVLHHHERWDGRGYPHGLQGEAVPLMARILAVADSFDAMTSSRPYRNAMCIESASRVVRSGRNSQWDGAIVDCFWQWLVRRTNEVGWQLAPSQSLIPREAPYDNIAQSVLTFGG